MLTVDKILATGKDAVTGRFVVPDNCIAPGKVQAQLSILISLQSHEGNQPKVLKVENSAKIEQKTSSNLIEEADAMGVIVIDAIKETSTANLSATNPQETKLALKVTTNSIADFFKERSRVFKAKDPVEMRAPSPPKQVQRENRLPDIPSNLQQYFPTVLPMGRMADKLKQAAPYNMFLTTVTASPATYSDPQCVTFLDILDPSLGELESSVQINFVVDMSWLFAQYTVAKVNKLPLLILHGRESPELNSINQMFPHIHSFMIHTPAGFGCHHTKMMLLFYKDKSMRVVVSTANLYLPDWNNRVQGLWISEKLGQVSEAVDGESVTNFRADLVRYLSNYKVSNLQPYIDRITKSDFSSVKVFLITSIPGWHNNDAHGLTRLGALLSKHSDPIDNQHPIVMQSSSVGIFGKSASEYLAGEVAKNFKKDSSSARVQATPSIKFIYPTMRYVQQSHDGVMGADCLTYRQENHRRQPWLSQHFHHWRCTSIKCDGAIPHIKTYCRYSDTGLYWFVLTSHNMSKSAWGVTKKNRNEYALSISSYEAGVAFFPRVVLNNKDQFPMNAAQQKDNTPIFRLPFDVPVLYGHNDAPFCMDAPGAMMM